VGSSLPTPQGSSISTKPAAFFQEKKLLIEFGSSYFNYEVDLFVLRVLPETN
jgi:hypothetical protein